MPGLLWVLLAALAVSSIGFKKYVWFISIGYGFAVTAIGLVLLAVYRPALTAGTICACLFFVLYGLRLGGYLALRELRSSSYNRKMKTEIKDGKGMSAAAKCAIWISAALLYFCQTSPVSFRLKNAMRTDRWLAAGLLIMAVGLAVESLADIQKSAAEERESRPLCEHRSVPDRPLPELLRGDAVLDGCFSGRDPRLPRRAAVDRGAGRLSGNRLCYVRRGEKTGNPPEPDIRGGSGVSEICPGNTDPYPADSPLQRGKVQVAGGINKGL